MSAFILGQERQETRLLLSVGVILTENHLTGWPLKKCFTLFRTLNRGAGSVSTETFPDPPHSLCAATLAG